MTTGAPQQANVHPVDHGALQIRCPSCGVRCTLDHTVGSQQELLCRGCGQVLSDQVNLVYEGGRRSTGDELVIEREVTDRGTGETAGTFVRASDSRFVEQAKEETENQKVIARLNEIKESLLPSARVFFDKESLAHVSEDLKRIAVLRSSISLADVNLTPAIAEAIKAVDEQQQQRGRTAVKKGKSRVERGIGLRGMFGRMVVASVIMAEARRRQMAIGIDEMAAAVGAPVDGWSLGRVFRRVSAILGGVPPLYPLDDVTRFVEQLLYSVPKTPQQKQEEEEERRKMTPEQLKRHKAQEDAKLSLPVQLANSVYGEDEKGRAVTEIEVLARQILILVGDQNWVIEGRSTPQTVGAAVTIAAECMLKLKANDKDGLAKEMADILSVGVSTVKKRKNELLQWLIKYGNHGAMPEITVPIKKTNVYDWLVIILAHLKAYAQQDVPVALHADDTKQQGDPAALSQEQQQQAPKQEPPPSTPVPESQATPESTASSQGRESDEQRKYLEYLIGKLSDEQRKQFQGLPNSERDKLNNLLLQIYQQSKQQPQEVEQQEELQQKQQQQHDRPEGESARPAPSTANSSTRV